MPRRKQAAPRRYQDVHPTARSSLLSDLFASINNGEPEAVARRPAKRQRVGFGTAAIPESTTVANSNPQTLMSFVEAVCCCKGLYLEDDLDLDQSKIMLSKACEAETQYVKLQLHTHEADGAQKPALAEVWDHTGGVH